MDNDKKHDQSRQEAPIRLGPRTKKIARKGVRSATQAGRLIEASIQDLLEGDMDVTIAGKTFQGVNSLVRVACHGDAVDELGKRMTLDEEEEKKREIQKLEEELKKLKEKE
jgi:hypothetical protein